MRSRSKEAIQRSQELLVYSTPWAWERPWVVFEVGAAWGLDKPYCFLRHGLTIEEMHSAGRVPSFLLMENHPEINEIEKGYLEPLKSRLGTDSPFV